MRPDHGFQIFVRWPGPGLRPGVDPGCRRTDSESVSSASPGSAITLVSIQLCLTSLRRTTLAGDPCRTPAGLAGD